VSGFTLIELLVVLLIISIAYAVAVPGVKAVLTGVEVNAAISYRRRQGIPHYL
jgi:prepilin-type N-terminal cleavage/methylation domain-containing protein